MLKEDYDSFSEIMLALAKMFPREAATEDPATVELYWKVLEEYSIDDVNEAAIWMLRNRESRTFPAAAELRKYIHRKSRPDALAVWTEIELALRSGGKGRLELDPVARKVVASMGGLNQIGSNQERQMPWVKKDFVDRYEALDRIAASHQALPAPEKVRELVSKVRALPGVQEERRGREKTDGPF